MPNYWIFVHKRTYNKTRGILNSIILLLFQVKLIYPEPGHVEINPDELWKSIKDVILNATQNAQIQVKDLKSLGISTQRATFISWRKDDSSYLHNFITWKDIRAKALAKELNHRWLLFKVFQYFEQLE